MLAQPIEQCALFLYFLTPTSVAREHCRREVNYSLEQSCGIIVVHLLLTDMPSALKLSLNHRQAIFRHGQTEQDYHRKLDRALETVLNLKVSAALTTVTKPMQASASVADVNARVRIAVLPLPDRTPEKNMGYLCEGMAEDLMNALFSVEGLQVLSATDTFTYKDSNVRTQEIGAALGANVVLEGSVQRAGTQVALTVRLVDVIGGVTLYSEKFVRELDAVFELQAQVADKVVEGLRSRIGPRKIVSPVSIATQNPIAYELYRQSVDGEESISKYADRILSLHTIVVLECVIAIDPSYYRAYVDLAIAYGYIKNIIGKEGWKSKARRLIEQLSTSEQGRLVAWGIEVELESDMSVLAEKCQDAIKQGLFLHAYPHPNGLSDVRAGYARALCHSGLHGEALHYYDSIDRTGEPNRYNNHIHQVGCLVSLKKFEQAISLSERLPLLQTMVDEADATFKHWLCFQIPIFQVLFAEELIQDSRYKQVLETLGLDHASRNRIRKQVALLTPLTGIKVEPLLDL